jgi:hypothetical protein
VKLSVGPTDRAVKNDRDQPDTLQRDSHESVLFKPELALSKSSVIHRDAKSMTGSLTLARLQRNPECQSVDTKPNKSSTMILNFMPRNSPLFGQTPYDDISPTMTRLRCSKNIDLLPKPTGMVNAPIRSTSIANGEESQFQNESCFSEAVNQMNRDFRTPEFDFFAEKKDRDLRPTSAHGVVKRINTEQPQKSD